MNLTLPRNILRRGKTYSVRFDVPIALRSVVGKKQIVRSLNTSDLGAALAKRDLALRKIQATLYDKKENTGANRIKPKPRGHTVRHTAKRWFQDSDGISGSTLNRYRSILEAFEVYSGNIEVTKINRQLALDFIGDLQTTRSPKAGELRSHQTITVYHVCLSSYWWVLDHWGYVDPNMRNPFSSLLRRIAGQKKKVDPRKKNLRPITRNEAEALLSYIAGNDRLKYQDEMYVIVRLLWATGCRLGEICKLRLEDIKDNGDHVVLRITDAKTEAGNRTVVLVGKPDIEALRGAVRLTQSTLPVSPDNAGHLFHRLLRGGYDNPLRHYVGKSLEKARKTFPETCNEWDMHSFRRSAVCRL